MWRKGLNLFLTPNPKTFPLHHPTSLIAKKENFDTDSF